MRFSVFAAFVASALLAAETAPPGIMLFAHARTKMQSHLKGQPNYVCRETIERSRKDPRNKRSGLLDVLRLEVAIAGQKELYAWPESNRFDDRELSDIVPAGGMIGSGAFEAHAWNLFFSGAPSITGGEWTEAGGHRLARYSYTVGQLESAFHLQVGQAAAVVAYAGSIWIDPESEEVTRFDMIADQIPPRLEMFETQVVVEYGNLEVGGRRYWLPVRTVDESKMFGGAENHNDGRFSDCREFVGESKLSFGDAPAQDEQPKPLTEVSLPEGVTVHIELVTPIDSDHSKTGDLIEAVLAGPIRQKKRVLFEKGSRVEGRLLQLQNSRGAIEAEVRFRWITNGTSRAAFQAMPEPDAPRPQAFIAGSAEPDSARRLTWSAEPGRPGSARISFHGKHLTLPRGSRSRWVTTAPSQVRP